MRGWGTAFLALLAAACVALAIGYRDNPLTRQARDYAETVATTSAATYVTLRTLNAFLSTAQEIELGGSLVVSGSAQPLKVLEPIDDTIERIAGVVFMVMIVTGVLAVSLGPVGAVGYAMMAVALALWLLERLIRRPRVAGMSRRLVLYGAFLGLAIPLAFVIAATVADRLTDETWARHSAIIDEITAAVETDALDEDGGISDTFQRIDRYQQLAVNVRDRADELIGSFVSLLAVFIFKIFILPLMLLGGFFALVRVAARPPAGQASSSRSVAGGGVRPSAESRE